MHHRSNDLGSTCVNGHVGYGSDGFKEMAFFFAGPSGSVVDAGADAFGSRVWVDSAKHCHAVPVVPMTARLFSVMFTSLAEFTILVPCVLREFEHLFSSAGCHPGEDLS